MAADKGTQKYLQQRFERYGRLYDKATEVCYRCQDDGLMESCTFCSLPRYSERLQTKINNIALATSGRRW